MSILVTGMEMPKDCRECPLQEYHERTGKTWCKPADRILAEDYKPIPFDGRPDWCPLVEVKTPQPEIKDEQAIEHLQSTGWMQNHDKQMYEMGLKEKLADDSGSYDSLIPSAQPKPLTDAEVVICKLYLVDLDKYKTCNEYKLLMGLLDGTACIQPEPEIYWGYTPTYERPLADDEIVPRLRDINAQLGVSYAIDRAIEIIEAVAERRTDE